MTEILFSAADRYYRFAVQELKRSFPVVDHVAVGPDAGLVRLRGRGLADVAAAARSGELRFVRHLANVTDRAPAAAMTGPEAIVDLGGAIGQGPDPIALQVWASGRVRHRPEDIRSRLETRLATTGRTIRRFGCEAVQVVCLGEHQIVVGSAPIDDALADWPGGRMRLADPPEQISRAEHKLEELFALSPLSIDGEALDLGASPGGWTRILLQRGARRVHAVDPGDPAPALARRKDVIWHRTTAGEYLHNARRSFRVVVNDMRMDPLQSARTMVGAARLQRRGDLIIMTLKITTHRPVEQIDRALALLADSYKIIFARQLQHNRNEVTVVGSRR